MPGNNASGVENTLTLDSDPAELERLRSFIDAFCDRENVPEEAHYHLNVALEELVLNAMKHGGCDPKRGAIRLAMQRDGDALRITLSDTGVSFNPLQAPRRISVTTSAAAPSAASASTWSAASCRLSATSAVRAGTTSTSSSR